MTVANGLAFINRALNDSDLRRDLNHSETRAALDAVLEKHNLAFSDSEFDEAYYLRLVKCQEQDDADQIKELKAWWVMLNQMFFSAAADVD